MLVGRNRLIRELRGDTWSTIRGEGASPLKIENFGDATVLDDGTAFILQGTRVLLSRPGEGWAVIYDGPRIPEAIWATDAASAYVVTWRRGDAGSRIERWDGTRWTEQHNFRDVAVHRIDMAGDVTFVAGKLNTESGRESGPDLIIRLEGATETRLVLPCQRRGRLVALARDRVVVACEQGIADWDGARWNVTDLDEYPSPYGGMVRLSTDEVLAYTPQSILIRRDGWVRAVPRPEPYGIAALDGTSLEDLWVITSQAGMVRHYDGRTWGPEIYLGTALSHVYVGRTRILATGPGGVLVEYDRVEP